MTLQELRVFFGGWSCGCGDPEAVVTLVRDVLTVIQQRWDDSKRFGPLVFNNPELHAIYKREDEALKALLPSDGLYYFVLYMLTHWDLLEHDGGVGGSWLTDKGKQALFALTAHTPEEIAASCCIHGYDVNDQTHDCALPPMKRSDEFPKFHELTKEKVVERYLRPTAEHLHEQAVQVCMSNGMTREQAEIEVYESLSLITIGDGPPVFTFRPRPAEKGSPT